MAKKLGDTHLGKVSLVKLDNESYLFKIDQCIWADTYHPQMNPHDVTCPFALIALAIYQITTGRDVCMADSEFSSHGSVTKVGPRSSIMDKLVG